MLISAYRFVKEKNRMCSANVCHSCPFSITNNGYNVPCVDFETIYTREAIEALEKWVKDNPIITNLKKLKEVFGAEEVLSLCNNDHKYFIGWCNEEYKGGE